VSADPVSAGERESATLKRARLLTTAMAAGVLLLTAASGVVSNSPVTRALAAPAALLGIVSPLLGFRTFAWLRERAATQTSHGTRCGAYLRATVLALSVTEAAAIFGVISFWMGGGIESLIGVVMHVILSGALWPTPEKLEAFLAATAQVPVEPEE
jgi:hypothetical protein